MPSPQVLPHVADLAPTKSGDPDMPTSPPKPPQAPHAPHAPQVLQSQQSRPAPRPGRQIRRCGRAVARPAWRALLLAGAVAAMLGMPAVAQAAATPAHATPASAALPVTPASAALPASQAAPASQTAPTGPADHAGPAHPASAVTTTAVQVFAHPAVPSGGICKVPGIGDIGGLLGFCAAGSGGIDALIRPPAGTPSTAKPTLYDQYGMAGQSWAAYDLQCSDMASLVGNNIAGVVFD